MSDFDFPAEVQSFIGLVGQYLEDFQTKLVLAETNAKIEAKEFAVDFDDRQVRVIVHRTKSSFETGAPEYRARMIDELPEEAANAFKGFFEFIANRFATIAALIRWKTSVSVCSQLLIPLTNQEASAGLFAASIAIGRPSILGGIQRAFQGAPSPQVETLSSWGDLDFEVLHYDTAHLGGVTRGKRSWSQQYLYGASVTLTPLHNNPAYGGGLLSRFRVPEEVFSSLDINELNRIEFEYDHVPLFGGWCRDRSDFVFTQFFPNFLKGLPQLDETITYWAQQRGRFIAGLVRDRLDTQS